MLVAYSFVNTQDVFRQVYANTKGDHMKFFIMCLAILLIPVTAVADEDCPSCGAPQEYRHVQCELVALHFTQPAQGPVAIRLYNERGAVIYDRYSRDRAFVKGERDTYRICRDLVERAARVTITRCTPEVARPASCCSEESGMTVLEAFERSATRPVPLS